MPPAVRFVFVIHDHQPIGNFDGVFEQAWKDAYLPFLELLERHPGIRVAIHTSGPLAEWLDEHHPEYLDRLARLADERQIEIVGGAFYEPVLAMLPPRDRVSQIGRFAAWLERRLGARVSGMWLAERVWDPGMAADLARAGVEWTILDDTHFKAAGLAEHELDRHWLTEGDGATLAVFPVSERLRYVIPFGTPEEVIDHLRSLAARRHGALAVFGDDGEKFGVWPDTHRTCFEEGWLERLFTLLEASADWVEMCLPSEVVRGVPPAGTVWLPECSYREMTEWVLPPAAQGALRQARVGAASDPRLSAVAPFIRGGSWRNFRLRYPEANEMYARAMAVSDRLERLRRSGDADPGIIEEATTALHRGQCNCAYWHGAFGGIYLPHLRNAVYSRLIEADTLLDRAARHATGAERETQAPRIEVVARDWDFDGRTEIRVSNGPFDAWLAPARGGILYELDLRDQRHNLLATLDRRPEAYHAEVLAGPGVARSIIDAAQPAKFKEEGLDRFVRHDPARRKMLVDHFWDVDVDPEAVADSTAMERGDFATGAYEAAVRQDADRVAVVMARTGNAWGIPFTLGKTVSIAARDRTIDIAYRIEGLPPGFRQHLAVEFNFAGMPADAPGRFFRDAAGRSLGHLGTRLDLAGATTIGLVDDWVDIDARLAVSGTPPVGIWTFPIRTVSQSEGGFESVHQSVVVMPHWIVEGDGEGVWETTLALSIDRLTASM